MFTTPTLRPIVLLTAFMAVWLCVADPVGAQVPVDAIARFKVQNDYERIEVIINSSRILEFKFDVPRILVNNPDVISATPLTPNSVQISARKQGYTQLNVWDKAGKVTTVDVIAIGDVRELEAVLKHEFPDAALRLRPLNSSLYVSGFVPKADLIGQIIRVAEDYFPKVINNITVGGVQKVLLHVKVMEVSRTKLRTMGVDWTLATGDDFLINGAAGIVGPAGAGNALNTLQSVGTNNVRFGIANGNTQFIGFLEMLQQNNLAKLLAEPTLTTMSGRPASFNVGGEIPVPLLSSTGAPSILFREFGTQIDFVPIVLGNGLIRLEVRPAITEVDSSLAVSGVPGFRTRRADVGVEMRAGQTLAIAGLVFNKQESETRGVPVLSDLPWVGGAFRRTHDRVNEVELVITVRPEFSAAMDPHEVPPCGPGELTTYPTNTELYGRGYIEVPKCCDDQNCNDGRQQTFGNYDRLPGYPLSAASGRPAPTTATGVNNNARPSAGAVPAPSASARNLNNASSHAAPRVAARPASSPAYSAQNRNNRASTPTASGNLAPGQRPALIGPLGYDELK